MKAVSLFSCIGVAEYYLQDIGVDVVVASDIDKKRCDVHEFLYPNTVTVCGDIRNDETKDFIIGATKGQKIDLVISTPPCQGMSSVGKNRSYNALTSQTDERNNLILESFKIIDILDSSYVIFENIPRVLKVVIPYENEYLSVKEILIRKYGHIYDIKIDTFNCCNYGVPQNRERCFIRLYKKRFEMGRS